MADARTSIITDWRISDDDLPDIAPGEEFERVIAPQKFVVLRQIRVINTFPGSDMTLVRLEIGMVKDIPFKQASVNGLVRTYRLGDLDEDLDKRLVKTGAAIAAKDAIAIAPGLEVRTILRNTGTKPAKPRSALIVHEEEVRK